MAFRVHEEVLQKDEQFRRESEKHAAEMAGFSQDDLSAGERRFLQKIGALSPQAAKLREKNLSTMEKTKLMLDEGKTLAEMAKARGVNVETIISHLEKIKEKEPSIALQYLGQGMPVARAKKIRAALQTGGMIDGKFPLAPAKTILGPGFSYEEIRLARLLM